MKHFVTLFLFVLLFAVNINGQPLFTESFSYNDGALMTMVGLNAGSPYFAAATASNDVSGGVWTPGSTSPFDDPMMVESGALTYPGYSLSGVGKKLFCPNLAPNSSNNRGFATFTSQQTVYYSMMVNMKDVTGLSAYPSTNGEYFTGLWATGNGTNANFRGLTVFQAGSVAGTWRIGVRSNQPTTVATTWYDVDLSVLTTYLIVVKYERNNPNCRASLWVNPSLSGSEPTPDAINDFGAVDPVAGNTDIGRFGIYQRGSRPHVWLGGIKVATSWVDAPLPVELTSFSAVANKSDIKLMWTTATEVNNYGFEIERKLVNSNYWIRIGFISGAGSSNSPKHYYFEDNNLSSGKILYRLKQLDQEGSFSYSQIIEVFVDIPNEFTLSEAYPNPFNPSTKINFTVAENSMTTLKIYNSLGQLVNTLFNGIAESGKNYDVIFSGDELTSGIYFAVLESSIQILTKKLILLK